jgi:K+-sensing histidine kinase KdpD
MNAARKIQQLIAILISLATLAFITVLGKNMAGLNAITVALLYLLVVLAVSALADLACGIVAAVVSGLLVNYFFLPPFGTFYIAAPEDWVAFFAYIVTAIVVSYFAATVRRRAVEADRLQAQLKRLSQLTAALGALHPRAVTLEVVTQELRNAFGLGYCATYLFWRSWGRNSGVLRHQAVAAFVRWWNAVRCARHVAGRDHRGRSGGSLSGLEGSG